LPAFDLIFFAVLLFKIFPYFITHNDWHEGLGKACYGIGNYKKMTFKWPAQKRKSRPLFPVPLHALVSKILLPLPFPYSMYIKTLLFYF